MAFTSPTLTKIIIAQKYYVAISKPNFTKNWSQYMEIMGNN